MTKRRKVVEDTGMFQMVKESYSSPQEMALALSSTPGIFAYVDQLEEWSLGIIRDRHGPIVQDAIELKDHIFLLRRYLTQADAGNCPVYQLVERAMIIGQISARMKVRRFEPAVVRGETVLDGARQAAALLHGPRCEREKLWSQYQAEVREIMARARVSYNRACHLAGKKLNVSYKTIQRRTVNPKRK